MRSMTGQGRGEDLRDGIRIVVEIRSVNRKQAEVQAVLPRELESLEPRVREAVGRVVARGRCEVRVGCDLPGVSGGARIDHGLARAYATGLRQLAAELGLAPGLSLDVLVRCPGVVGAAGGAPDAERLWPALESALQAALAGLDSMRRREGEALAADLAQRVGELRGWVGRIRERAPEVLARYRAQLLQRVRAAGLPAVPADDERLLKEVVLFADRSDVAEELARLESHFGQFEDCCRSAEPVGRKLDFLAQEMNREINTLGAKANDAFLSAGVVELKTTLERFREQAQNVE
ncbi:MAG: YicC/YloC family endoribonuclease [Verrucomicrobiota bacterium]